MLTKEEIIALNRRMVGYGAPITRDQEGYNQVHYWRMQSLAECNNITDLQAYAILDNLSFYKNTQLSAEKDAIAETLEAYQKKLGKATEEYINNKSLFSRVGEEARHERIARERLSKREAGIAEGITITKVAKSHIVLRYSPDVFIEEMRSLIASHRDQAHWLLDDDGTWSILTSYPFLKRIEACLAKCGFDVSQLTYAREHTNDFLLEHGIDVTQKPKVDVSVERLEPVGFQMTFTAKADDDLRDTLRQLPLAGYVQNVHGGQAVTLKTNSIIHDAMEIQKATNIELTPEGAKAIQETLDFYHTDCTLIDPTTLALPFSPYPYQVEDAKKILSHTRGLIGHEMGCGKTLIAIMVGASIPERKLVIVPESLRLNWLREIERATPNADAQILLSKDDFHTGADWTIVGYKTAAKFAKELEEENFQAVFVDEAHYCKTVNNFGVPTTSRARTVMDLAKRAKYCYLLTGTPLPTRNKDAYNLLNMLDVQGLPSFFDFGREYCNGVQTNFGWDFNGNSNQEGLHKMLNSVTVRRLKKEALPGLTKTRQFIPMISDGAKIKKAREKMCKADSMSSFLGEAQTLRRLLSEQKLSICTDFVDGLLAEDKSVVVVSEFVDTIHAIKSKYGDDCCCIMGGMSDAQKTQSIDDFQSHKKHVCAVNTIAGGVGITLTAAYNMIIVDFDWTPANMIQVEDRICRSGQTESCNIFYICAENELMEQYFVQTLTEKSANINAVVDHEENSLDLVATKRDESTSVIKALRDIYQKEGLKKGAKKHVSLQEVLAPSDESMSAIETQEKEGEEKLARSSKTKNAKRQR